MQENTKQQESLHTQSYTEQKTNSDSNSRKIKINRDSLQQIENTIFGIANDPESGWFLTIGQNMITEPFETREEAIAQLTKDKWNIIMKLIILVVEQSIVVTLEEKGLLLK